jgi:hypothetical protein
MLIAQVQCETSFETTQQRIDEKTEELKIELKEYLAENKEK